MTTYFVFFFEKQKQFIYDASHELKTPLAIIMASAETYEENPKETKWLNNIKEESARMNKLVLNLLDLSKTENLKADIVYSKVNLSKIINNKALSFESLMFEKKIETYYSGSAKTITYTLIKTQ